MTDTATSAYLTRFNARERFTGDDGGIYTVRQLRPSELFRLRDMMKDADGATFNVMTAVASICEIDHNGNTIPIVFPKSRKDLDGMLDRIGFKGIGALTPAFNKLNGVEDAPEREDAATADAA